ncbi:hypothetical protein GCK32_003950 [Trichostrongylus colubriformis]|uniref:Uncharacterized protein n=1 Tax=Trichostrongylus colubriformis TaxID=6319 RepID=A0AAN8FS77_TRICO
MDDAEAGSRPTVAFSTAPPEERTRSPSTAYLHLDADKILSAYGKFGRYQMITYLITNSVHVLFAINMMVMPFITEDPKFECQITPPDGVHWEYTVVDKCTVMDSNNWTLACDRIPGARYYYNDTNHESLASEFNLGFSVIGWVLCMESVALEFRSLIPLMGTITWVIGYLAAGVLRLFISNWRWLYFAVSVPGLLTIPYYWLTPESIHWLITNKKNKGVSKYIRTSSRFNRVEIPLHECKSTNDLTTEVKKRTFFDMFKNPGLVVHLIMNAYILIVMNGTYWALSLFSTELSEDKMTGFFLSGIVEIPAGLIAIALLVSYMGPQITMIFPLLAKVFNSIVWCSQPLLYTESTPTAVRNVFCGVVGFLGDLGSVLAPYLKRLEAIHKSAPTLLIAVMSISSAVLVLTMSETKDRKLPEDIDDFEPGPLLHWMKKKKKDTKMEERFEITDGNRMHVMISNIKQANSFIDNGAKEAKKSKTNEDFGKTKPHSTRRVSRLGRPSDLKMDDAEAGSRPTGSTVIGWVLCMESVALEFRSLIPLMGTITFVIGYTAAGLLHLLISNWRWLYFAISVPGLLTIPYYWLTPESIHWLITNKKNKEVFRYIRTSSRFNHVEIPLHECKSTNDSTTEVKKRTFFDMFKNPGLVVYLIMNVYILIVMNGTYWALSLFSTELSKDKMTGFFLSGVVEIPAGLIASALLKLHCKFCSQNAAVSVGPQIAMIFPLLAKVFNSIVWSSQLLLYTESTPTAVRNVFCGAVGFLGDLGSVLAPYLKRLETIHKSAPTLLIAVMSISAAMLVLTMSETKDRKLPEDIDDFEPGPLLNWLKKKKKDTKTEESSPMITLDPSRSESITQKPSPET